MAKVQLRDIVNFKAITHEGHNLKEVNNDYIDVMLRKFKKQVEKDEILDECRRREFFMKKSIKRKEKSKRAKIKALKAKRKN